MKTKISLVLMLLFLAPSLYSQTEDEKKMMLKLVNEGLELRPKSFFNKGNTYDYKKNVVVTEIIIPEDHEYKAKGPTCTFNIVLKYTVEGEEKTNRWNILSRNGSSGGLEFYSARLK